MTFTENMFSFPSVNFYFLSHDFCDTALSIHPVATNTSYTDKGLSPAFLEAWESKEVTCQ